MSRRTPSGPSPKSTRPWLCQDLPLLAQPTYLQPQPAQLLTLRCRLPSLRRPSSRSACATQLRIDCAEGSNSLARWYGLRPDRTSSRIGCRYSEGYRLLLLDIVGTSSAKDQVSTKPGQAFRLKAWLEMAVVEYNGKGGKYRTNRATRERKGTLQGAPISPLLSSIYMCHFILGFRALGFGRRFDAEIINYADV